MAKISFQNVSYTYKNGEESHLALRNVSFDVYEGEILCLVGHSGCGKSTILNLLAGLIKPDEGSVLIDGASVEAPGPDRSIVFQNYSLFPWQTAQKNVAFAIRQTHAGVSKKQALEQALDYLDQVNMKDAATRFPYQLSGGMRQRVAIARALGQDAPVMLLDEPFGALDVLIRKQLQSLLLELWRDNAARNQAKTAIFVTHDIDEAMCLADRIIFMCPREIVETFELPRNRHAKGATQGAVKTPSEMKEIKNRIMQLFAESAAGSALDSESADGMHERKSAAQTSENTPAPAQPSTSPKPQEK